MHKHNINHPNDLLKHIQDFKILDLLKYATDICDEQVLNAFVEPESGLYVKGSSTNLLKANKLYFNKTDFDRIVTEINHNAFGKDRLNRGIVVREAFVNYEDRLNEIALTCDQIIQAEDDIVDDSGVVIFSRSDIKSKSRYLSTEPTIPVIPLQVTRIIAINFINVFCPYSRITFRDRLENYIKPEYHDIIYDDVLDNCFNKLLDELYTYLNNHTWNIYFLDIRNTDLIIKRACDWRIYDWHCMKYQAEE